MAIWLGETESMKNEPRRLEAVIASCYYTQAFIFNDLALCRASWYSTNAVARHEYQIDCSTLTAIIMGAHQLGRSVSVVGDPSSCTLDVDRVPVFYSSGPVGNHHGSAILLGQRATVAGIDLVATTKEDAIAALLSASDGSLDPHQDWMVVKHGSTTRVMHRKAAISKWLMGGRLPTVHYVSASVVEAEAVRDSMIELDGLSRSATTDRCPRCNRKHPDGYDESICVDCLIDVKLQRRQ